MKNYDENKDGNIGYYLEVDVECLKNYIIHIVIYCFYQSVNAWLKIKKWFIKYFSLIKNHGLNRILI